MIMLVMHFIINIQQFAIRKFKNMDVIEKKKVLDWLEHYVNALVERGPTFGSFLEQEATLSTLLTFKYFILTDGDAEQLSLFDARHSVAKKYRLTSVLSFSEQNIYSQELLSQILRDLWDFK